MNNINFPTDKPSRHLYKAGGWTSVLFLGYSFVTILILVFLNGGYPETATECFDMIEENRFVALLRLDIVSVVVIPALFCILSGVTIFITGVNLVSIIIVSDKYHATTSPEMKQQLLAACEAMLASDMWINTGAIIRGILIETGAIIFSVLMLKTLIFNKATGWIGLLTHGFDLSSRPLYIVWFVMIGLRLFKLSNIKPDYKTDLINV